MGMNIASRGGRGRGYRRQQFHEINVTPMVDVMLVLLIIFMITAPMLTAGVQVDLPESAASPIQDQGEMLTITVKNDGKIFLQKTEITVEALGARLKAVGGENKDAKIFVRGDKTIDYGRMMSVVGEINAAGFSKIALVTESQEGKRRGK